jgi:HlyD family secretion protein
MKKTTISIMLVAVLGIGGFGVYRDVSVKAASQNKTSQYSEAQASVQNIESSVSGSGSVQTAQSDVLKAASKDTVASVLVSKDQVVTEGQELVTFQNGSAPIVAPYDGVISDVNVSAGDSVSASQQLLSMFDNKNFLTTISVDETDLPSLQIGQKVDIKVNAYPDEKFTGTIKDISQEGQYSNGVSTFDVTISFDNIDNIKVGMSTEATIITADKNNALAVPIEAVKDIKGEKYVLVIGNNGTPTLQKVQLGINNGKVVEVTNGLIAGEDVELPQVQASSTNTSKTKGLGGFQMMQGGGARNNSSSSGQGSTKGN